MLLCNVKMYFFEKICCKVTYYSVLSIYKVAKQQKEGGESMNGEKILNTIPKLQKLTEKQLDMVETAINAFLLVQTIESVQESPNNLKDLIATM